MEFNYLVILEAVLSGFLIGGLWYSPVMFYKCWIKENGFHKECLKKGNRIKTFVASFLLSLIIAFNLAAFPEIVQILPGKLTAGVAAGSGWVAMGFGITYLFEERSLKLWLITTGYPRLTFTVNGWILGPELKRNML